MPGTDTIIIHLVTTKEIIIRGTDITHTHLGTTLVHMLLGQQDHSQTIMQQLMHQINNTTRDTIHILRVLTQRILVHGLVDQRHQPLIPIKIAP